MADGRDLAAWREQLVTILQVVAELKSKLDVSRSAAGLSSAVEKAGRHSADDGLEGLQERVRRANTTADRLLTADPVLRDVVHPLLGVPGEKPEVDLRPWITRFLERFSATGARTSLVESLETLRLEADAALTRAARRPA